jgi:hypothetical protein
MALYLKIENVFGEYMLGIYIMALIAIDIFIRA